MAHQSFDELEWYLRRLRYARQQGKLVFVLGAGINKEYGLPDWAQMLVRLTRRSGELDTLPEPRSESASKQFIDDVIADPLLQAAAIRGAFASSSDWLRTLGHVLTYPPEVLRDKTKPMGKVAQIVVRQYRDDPRRHIAILTFNYDDLMEAALRQELGKEEANRIVVSVSNATEMGRARQRPGIYIYHLHGFLANKASDIVLDAYTYVRILSAPGNHWSWACMNTFLFQKDSGAMFIGLSLLDPSLRLLLTQSATNGMPLSAVFVGKPLEPRPPQPRSTPPSSSKPAARQTKKEIRRATAEALKSEFRRAAAEALKVAWMMRDVQTLFDNLLEELSLIPYHVTAWSEVGPLLDRVMEND